MQSPALPGSGSGQRVLSGALRMRLEGNRASDQALAPLLSTPWLFITVSTRSGKEAQPPTQGFTLTAHSPLVRTQSWGLWLPRPLTVLSPPLPLLSQGVHERRRKIFNIQSQEWLCVVKDGPPLCCFPNFQCRFFLRLLCTPFFWGKEKAFSTPTSAFPLTLMCSPVSRLLSV